MSKFKVGDKVRVKSDLVVCNLYKGVNFAENMNKYTEYLNNYTMYKVTYNLYKYEL